MFKLPFYLLVSFIFLNNSDALSQKTLIYIGCNGDLQEHEIYMSKFQIIEGFILKAEQEERFENGKHTSTNEKDDLYFLCEDTNSNKFYTVRAKYDSKLDGYKCLRLDRIYRVEKEVNIFTPNEFKFTDKMNTETFRITYSSTAMTVIDEYDRIQFRGVGKMLDVANLVIFTSPDGKNSWRKL